MMKTGLLAFVTLALAAPAVAEEPKSAASGGDKMICKKQALTGTRMARKICFTRADWDAKAEQDRRALAEMTGNTVQRESGRN